MNLSCQKAQLHPGEFVVNPLVDTGVQGIGEAWRLVARGPGRRGGLDGLQAPAGKDCCSPLRRVKDTGSHGCSDCANLAPHIPCHVKLCIACQRHT